MTHPAIPITCLIVDLVCCASLIPLICGSMEPSTPKKLAVACAGIALSTTTLGVWMLRAALECVR